MRRILALTAMACLVSVCACTSLDLWSVGSAEQARERASTLRAEAGGSRTEARALELRIQQAQSEIQTHRAIIENLSAEREDLMEQIESARSRRQGAFDETAQALDKVIDNYRSTKGRVEAQIDDRSGRVNALEDQIHHWRVLRESYLQMAADKEDEAVRVEQYAAELPEG